MVIKLMKVVLLCLILTACVGEFKNDDNLEKTVQTFKQSLLDKDAQAFNSVMKGEENYVDGNFENSPSFNVHSLDTISTEINGDSATVKIKAEIEELIEYPLNSYYVDLISYLTLTLEFADSKWTIINIEDELDPTTTRPPAP